MTAPRRIPLNITHGFQAIVTRQAERHFGCAGARTAEALWSLAGARVREASLHHVGVAS